MAECPKCGVEVPGIFLSYHMADTCKLRKQKTKLIRVTIEKQPDGTWDVTRERAENGEKASGMTSLDEALVYVRIHDELWDVDL